MHNEVSVKARLLSTIIAIALLSSLVSPVFAITLPVSETVVDSCEMVLDEHDGYVLSICGEDLSNGDTRFSIIENGQVISCSYVDRSAETIIYTEYQNGVEISRTEKVLEKQVHTKAAHTQREDNASVDAVVLPDIPIGGGYVNVGNVGYNHYIQGMNSGVNYINWSYSTSTNPTSICDLNGQYKDFSAACAQIFDMLGLFSAAAAMEIARVVFGALGIALSAINVIIPKYEVSCSRTEVVWRASVGSKETYVQGFRCVVTHPNKAGQVVYEGDYYPTTAIADHNVTLASSVYTYFYWGHDRFEIASWPV